MSWVTPCVGSIHLWLAPGSDENITAVPAASGGTRRAWGVQHLQGGLSIVDLLVFERCKGGLSLVVSVGVAQIVPCCAQIVL